MESRTKILGHSVHRMIVAFPIALLSVAVLFDILFLTTKMVHWNESAFWTLGLGILGGVVAAPFGWMDWFAIPKGTKAKTVGLVHGIGNVVVLFLFAMSFILRVNALGVSTLPAYILSFVAEVLMGMTGWLGGELVTRMGIGIDTHAHLNRFGALAEDLPGKSYSIKLEKDAA